MSLVNVVMPTHNRSKLLDRAIKSVLAQTFTDYELIIVDDCSTDDTQQVVSGIKDSRIRYIKTERNSGGSMIPRKIGNKYSNSKYIAVLDDDDYWADKDKLALQVAYLESHEECIMVGTDWVAVDKDGNKLFYHNYPKSYRDIKKRLLFRNCFYHSAVMYRRESFIKMGGYGIIKKRMYHNFSDDYEMWLKMGTLGEIINLPVYGAGHIYTPYIKLSRLDQSYYMIMHMNLIKSFKKYYDNYYWAMIFRLLIVVYSILLSNSLKMKISKSARFS